MALSPARWRVTVPMRCLLIALWLCVTVDAFAQDKSKFSIPAQPLTASLLQLGQQGDVSIAFNRALVAGRMNEALEGEMDLPTALTRILANSGLGFEFVRPTLIRIIAAPVQVAQSPATEPPSAGVEEVIVTARRRSENLLDVPISIFILDGEEASAANLYDVESFSAYIPTLQVRPNTSQKDRSLFIRGIGTITTSQSAEPSVSTVIDGVVMSRSGQAMLDILDLDQLEVLSGPQGTLFGKNASAGVLNITTHDPTDRFSGVTRISYYEGDEYRVSGAIGGPLADSLGARISAFTADFDGNIRNLHYDRHANGFRHDGARGKLVYRPRDDLVFHLGMDFTRSHEDVPSGTFTNSGIVAYCPSYLIDPPNPNPCTRNVAQPNPALDAVLAASDIRASADNRRISTDALNRTEDRNGGVSLQADWQFDAGYQLTSISAWREWRNVMRDYDFDQLASLDPLFPEIRDAYRVSFTQTSQELRIASPRDGRFDFVAGLYFMHADSDERYLREVTRFVSTTEPALADFGRNHFGSTSDNVAAFGEVNLQLSSRWRAFVGYRHIWDRVTFFTDRQSTATATNRVPAVAPPFADEGVHRVESWAGRAGVQFDVASDVMAYATASRGYKGPAYNVFFNMQSFNTAPLDAEKSHAYEVGIKSRLWNRQLQLEAAVFSTEFHDYQAMREQYVNGAPVTNLLNAGTVVNRGAELRVALTPTSGLTSRLFALYNDAFIRRFSCEPGLMFCNLNGNPLPFASRWRVNANQAYRRSLTGALDLEMNLAYRWQSQVHFQFIDPPNLAQPSYGIWDASVGLRDPADRWSTTLLVKNLLDQNYSSYLTQGNLGGTVRWVPRDATRYLGLTVQLAF